jgi:Tol biopolymer transport system component
MRSTIVCFSALLSISFFAATAARADEAKSVESTYLKNIRQVTSGMAKAGEGYFSPDGKQIIYQAVPLDYPFYQIYTQPLTGDEIVPRRLSTGRGRTTCSFFSPDGKKILFASSHLDPNLDETEAAARKVDAENKRLGRRASYKWDFDPHLDIFEADLQGNITKQLTQEKGYDAEGAYSASGKLIAFCSDRDGDPDIYVMNSDGTNVRQLTNVPGYDGGPFISPDEKWVVFRSDRKVPDQLQIYVIGIDGKHETALTDNTGVNWGPYWHPTAPYLIWSAADHSDPTVRPNFDLWLARYTVKDGKFTIEPPVRITDSSSADVLPVFSPDGKQLMWTSTRTDDHSSQLFIADFQLPK